MKGTYILVIRLALDCHILVGSLGQIFFPRGLYFYIGSAMGQTGALTLLNRIKRHITNGNNKKIFWHIDYLLNSMNATIIRLFLIPSKEKYECVIAQEILKKSDNYINDFGSSDCSCKSHLFYFDRLPNFKLSDIV